jgi:elongation factor Ts
MSATEIPASLVMELRQATGAGMMDCKRALVDTGGDLEAARQLLREQGMAAAEKRQVRETTEGLVGYRLSRDRGTIVAVGCETEPVSNNEEFQAFAKRVLDLVEEQGPDAVDELNDERQELVAKLGENIVVRGAARFEKESDDEVLAAYVHPPANKIGVLVKLRGGTDELARQLAMHISFAAPRWQTRDEVGEDYVQAERDVYLKLPEVAAKPEEARAKIVEGMLNKRFFAVAPGGVLEDQAWIYDDKRKVGQVLKEGGAELAGFVRYSVAE